MTHPCLCDICLKARDEELRRARSAVLNDCIGLLRKWFFGTNKDARACEKDMRKLATQ